MQLDYLRNGVLDHTVEITDLQFDHGVPDNTFAIPEDIAEKFKKRGIKTVAERALGAGKEIAPDIVLIAGAWNSSIIRQTDGVVILEGPMSSAYSAKVLAEATKRFPGVGVKAVITTSDAWPHIGGLREYAARGIPIYAIGRTVPLINRLLSSPHTQAPDALASRSRKANIHAVQGKLELGSGPNRLVMIPLRGETTERQMLVYFPEKKLLYGSDAFQKQQDSTYFHPQTISEVASVVEREHLAVEKFFMMHMELTPWSEPIAALNAAQK
jgi:hypothetical protein